MRLSGRRKTFLDQGLRLQALAGYATAGGAYGAHQAKRVWKIEKATGTQCNRGINVLYKNNKYEGGMKIENAWQKICGTW